LKVLDITPDDGKKLKAGSLKYNDGTDNLIDEDSFSFIMPAADVVVTAEFEDVSSPTLESITITTPANNWFIS
jgi:hypothetical protein